MAIFPCQRSCGPGSTYRGMACKSSGWRCIVLNQSLRPRPRCPLWVRTGHQAVTWAMSAFHPKADIRECGLECPLCARSGLMQRSKSPLFAHFEVKQTGAIVGSLSVEPDRHHGRQTNTIIVAERINTNDQTADYKSVSHDTQRYCRDSSLSCCGWRLAFCSCRRSEIKLIKLGLWSELGMHKSRRRRICLH